MATIDADVNTFYTDFEMTRENLELAGFVEPNGNTGRIVESGRLAPPKWARIERGKLHWKDFGFGTIAPPSDLLDRFVKLYEAKDSAILEFALNYGTLRLPLFSSLRRGKGRELGLWSGRPYMEGREPLVRWRNLSRHASNLLQVAAALRARENLSFEELSELMRRECNLSHFGTLLSLMPIMYPVLSETGVLKSLRELIESASARGVDVHSRGPSMTHKESSLEATVQAAWRVWAKRMRKLGAEAEAAETGFRNEIAKMKASRKIKRYSGQFSLADVKCYLRAEIAAWNKRLGPISFGIEQDYETDQWNPVFDFGGSVPCYIGFQLMLVLAGGDIFVCSACHKPYIRPRGRSAPKGFRKTPKPGELNYCQSEDCIRERNRLASERRRGRARMGEQK